MMAEAPTKTRYSLPIREPSGAINPDGVAAAAQRLDQTNACPAAKAKAKAMLLSAYRQMGREPPASLKASTVPKMSVMQLRAAHTRTWLLGS